MWQSQSTSTSQSILKQLDDNKCYIFDDPPTTAAYEWHLNDKKDSSALKKAKTFHSEYEKLHAERNWLIKFLLRSSSTMKDLVYALKNGYLYYIDISNDPIIREQITEDFREASKNDDPVRMVRAYSRSQALSERINVDMAKNTHHELTMYCTPLNCNVLARTQDGIGAFVSVLFHPKLNDHLCKGGSQTVYRGSKILIDDVLKNYKEDSIIITTTFLSTSKKHEVAKMFCSIDPNKKGQISVLCRYEIFNYRRTALDMKEISIHPHEKEVLIFPYVPFRITSITVETAENENQTMEVLLKEIGNDDDGDIDRQSVSTIETLV